MKLLNKVVILFDIDYTLFNVDLFKQSNLTKFLLYDDVKDALNSLQKISILGISSEGESGLQRKKMQKTNIEKYFKEENIHIAKNKPNSLKKNLSQYKKNNLFLLDDKLTILRQAKKSFPLIFTIWVRRGKYAQEQKEVADFRPDAQVFNLTQAVDIIKSKLK